MANKKFYFLKSLLILCVILISVVLMSNKQTKKHGETLAHLELLTHYLEEYKNDNGDYPLSDDGLVELYNKQYIANGAEIDPWKSNYRYSKVENTFILYSIGKNKVDDKGFGDDISLSK